MWSEAMHNWYVMSAVSSYQLVTLGVCLFTFASYFSLCRAVVQLVIF